MKLLDQGRLRFWLVTGGVQDHLSRVFRAQIRMDLQAHKVHQRFGHGGPKVWTSEAPTKTSESVSPTLGDLGIPKPYRRSTTPKPPKIGAPKLPRKTRCVYTLDSENMVEAVEIHRLAGTMHQNSWPRKNPSAASPFTHLSLFFNNYISTTWWNMSCSVLHVQNSNSCIDHRITSTGHIDERRVSRRRCPFLSCLLVELGDHRHRPRTMRKVR